MGIKVSLNYWGLNKLTTSQVFSFAWHGVKYFIIDLFISNYFLAQPGSCTFLIKTGFSWHHMCLWCIWYQKRLEIQNLYFSHYWCCLFSFSLLLKLSHTLKTSSTGWLLKFPASLLHLDFTPIDDHFQFFQLRI